MFPSTAPQNGPSSSFDIAQDRLSISQALQVLFAHANDLDDVHDPRLVTLSTPVLGNTLQVGLPAGGLTLNGHYGLLAPMSLTLPAHVLTYVDAAPVGNNALSDFPAGDLLPQTTGTYAGGVQVIPGALTASSPVNISGGQTLVQRYFAYMSNVNGGWGPGLLDAYGNGLVVRAAQNGGGVFLASNYAASGSALTLLPQHSASDTNLHTFELQTTYLGGSTYAITLLIDTVQVASFQQTLSVSPTALFPAFVSDGTTVFLSSWAWYNSDGTPVLGWVATSTPLSAPDPGPVAGGTHLFLIETGSAPIAIRALHQQKTVITQVAAMRSALASLQKAYL